MSVYFVGHTRRLDHIDDRDILIPFTAKMRGTGGRGADHPLAMLLYHRRGNVCGAGARTLWVDNGIEPSRPTTLRLVIMLEEEGRGLREEPRRDAFERLTPPEMPRRVTPLKEKRPLRLQDRRRRVVYEDLVKEFEEMACSAQGVRNLEPPALRRAHHTHHLFTICEHYGESVTRACNLAEPLVCPLAISCRSEWRATTARRPR